MKHRLFLLSLSLFVMVQAYSQLTLQPGSSTSSVSANLSAPSALFFKSFQLRDGEAICVTPQYPSDEYCGEEKSIANKYYNQLISSGVLKAFDIHKHEKELRQYMEEAQLYNNNPLYEYSYMFSRDTYYHSLAQVKAVRGFGCRVISDMLVDYCEYFPKDFKTKIVSELTDVLMTIKKCKKHRYECVEDKWGDLCLSVDGKINNSIAYSLEGFIARRICMDNIPVSEMELFVSSLLKKLKSVNTESNPDILYKVTINNELSYCLGIEGPFFISEKNRKKTIPFNDRRYLQYYNSYGQKVFFSNGSDGRFYRICNQDCYNGIWKPLPQYYKDIRELILSAEGEEIYRSNAIPE